MTKRSSTSGQPEPVFFTDRDLGRSVAATLAAAGLSIEPYHKHFALDNVPDREWPQNIQRIKRLIRKHDEPFAAKVYQGRKDVDLWVTHRQWQEARRLRRW